MWLQPTHPEDMQMKNTRLIASLGLIAALLATGPALARDDKNNQNKPATGTQTPDTGTKSGKKADKKAEKKAEKHDAAAKVGSPAPAFTLKDTNGKDVSLADYKGKVVVLEWMNSDCPVCAGKMKDKSVPNMVTEAKGINSDVVFLFIDSTAAHASNPTGSGEYLKTNGVTATALMDGDGTVGHLYGARTTPHCFVIDDKGVLVYEGAIDDQKGTNYVVNAVKALKEGKAVTPSQTKSYGCNVKYKS